MQFIEQYFDDFYPSASLVPGLYNGKPFGLPVVQLYKSGKRIDGKRAMRSQVALEAILVKNGGYI